MCMDAPLSSSQLGLSENFSPPSLACQGEARDAEFAYSLGPEPWLPHSLVLLDDSRMRAR